MASLGHVAVGMAAARVYRGGRIPSASSMAWWAALSLLPDVDVVGFALGVQYGDPWGHRGATHSLFLSMALAIAIGIAARLFERPSLRTGLVAGAVLVSHPLLDAMTDGGLGCALLWPFDLTRYFAPWRPIPVAPIGLHFVSLSGLVVALSELVLFAPALLFALPSPALSAKRVAVVLALWVAAAGVLAYSDTTRDSIVGFLRREDTQYAAGYSDDSFRRITPGQSETTVRRLLGVPLAEHWFYTPPDPRPPADRPLPEPGRCLVIRLEAGVVAAMQDADACRSHAVDAGLPRADALTRLGVPIESCWQYSRSGGNGPYRQRVVCFASGSVQRVIRKSQ